MIKLSDIISTKKGQLAIAAASIMLLVGIAAIGFAAKNKSPAEVTHSGHSASDGHNHEETVSNEVFVHEHDDHTTDDGEETPLQINSGEYLPTDIQNRAVPVAEAAAREFISQRTGEPYEVRQNRLKNVFAPESQPIYDLPPPVDPTYTADTHSTPAILYSRWNATDSAVLVTVAIRVTTRDNADPNRIVSEIYQGWEVSIIPNAGNYAATDIKISEVPIVVQEGQ